VSAGIAALTSAFPVLFGGTVWLCLAALAIITGLNLWGVSESAKVFTVPTLAFIAAMAAVILGGLFRAHPAVPLDHHLGASTEAVGILLILKAFASGCSALTGVEAIANAVPEFREPRARRAQSTEVWLGILLGGMLIGLGVLIRKFSVVPHSGITVLAQLTEASLGHNIVFYAIQLITMVLLALAANTSFGACRCWRPCWPRTISCRTCSGCGRTGRCTGTASSGSPSWAPPCWRPPTAIPRRWSRCTPWECS
jgi:amino acid transporter